MAPGKRPFFEAEIVDLRPGERKLGALAAIDQAIAAQEQETKVPFTAAFGADNSSSRQQSDELTARSRDTRTHLFAQAGVEADAHQMIDAEDQVIDRRQAGEVDQRRRANSKSRQRKQTIDREGQTEQ